MVDHFRYLFMNSSCSPSAGTNIDWRVYCCWIQTVKKCTTEVFRRVFLVDLMDRCRPSNDESCVTLIVWVVAEISMLMRVFLVDSMDRRRPSNAEWCVS